MKKAVCRLCGSKSSALVSVIDERPKLETDYKIPEETYHREIRRCLDCNVYYNHYDFKLITEDFYNGFYNESIETGRLLERFERITNLPYSQSDNKQRSARVFNYFDRFYDDIQDRSLLDVGTGTGVFVHEISKSIPHVSCVDPDPQSIAIVRSNTDVEKAWVGTLDQIPENHKFDIITYNKVLEHVEDPISLLRRTKDYLTEDGSVYVELPYATDLVKHHLQDERAEFFVEHFTTFTDGSLEFLLKESGFRIHNKNHIVEPSGKHSVYAFATPETC